MDEPIWKKPIIIFIAGFALGSIIFYLFGLNSPRSIAPAGSPQNKINIVVGTISGVASSSLSLNNGWIINIDASTLIKFQSGLKAASADLKKGALINVSLNNPQTVGTVNSNNIKLISIIPLNTTSTKSGVSTGAPSPPDNTPIIKSAPRI